MSGHGYKYVGDGARYRGVPSRDLTQDEFDKLGPLEQRTVNDSADYKPMTATESKAADKASEPEGDN